MQQPEPEPEPTPQPEPEPTPEPTTPWTTADLTPIALPSQLTITDLDPPSSYDRHITPIPSSLSRRVLATTSNQNQNNPSFNSRWRGWFFEQMSHDFEVGFNRSQVVNRLRHRMNQIRSYRLQASLTTTNDQLTTHLTDQQTSLPNHWLGPSATDPTSTSHFGSRNLVDNSLSKSHYTHLLYCGSTPDQTPSNSTDQNLDPTVISHQSNNSSGDVNISSSNPTNSTNHQSNNPYGDHRGCGRLITIRATLMTPNPARGFMYDETTGRSHSMRSRRSEYDLLMTSDSHPMPDSVDRVDDLTQDSFETDASNLFNRGSSNRISCSCQRTYLGCLSCGNIVGHTVTILCRQCQMHSTLYQHSYYLNRLTAIPRYVNWPTPLDLHNVRVPNDSSDKQLMSWTHALLKIQIDIDAGYVGQKINNRPQPSTSTAFADNDPPPRLSERVRNAILMGSVYGLIDSSMYTPRNDSIVNFSSFDTTTTLVDHQTSANHSQISSFPSSLHPTTRRSWNISSNSSSNRLSSSASHNDRFGRAGLTRRPAVRIFPHSHGRSMSRSRMRPRSSSTITDSWLTRGRIELGLDEDGEEDMEVKEGEDLMTIRSSSTNNSRRLRYDDDDNDNQREREIFSTLEERNILDSRLNQDQTYNDNSRRMVRRRLHNDQLTSQVDKTRSLSFRSNFTFAGDVCAR